MNICQQTCGCHSDMLITIKESLIGAFIKFRKDPKDSIDVFTSAPNNCTAVSHNLHSIFILKTRPSGENFTQDFTWIVQAHLELNCVTQTDLNIPSALGSQNAGITKASTWHYSKPGSFSFWLVFVLFLKHCLTVYPWLAWSLIHRPGCLQLIEI